MKQTENMYSTGEIYLSESYKNYVIPSYNENLFDFTLFVSCYNEEKFIHNTLMTILDVMKEINRTYELIVIDDGSKDSSIKIIKSFILDNPSVNVLFRVNAKNKGLAENYIDAAFIGHGKYFRLICGDNSEPVSSIVSVLKLAGEADIIIPYYTLIVGKKLSRKIISSVYTHIINLISGNRINYYNGLHLHLRYNVRRWHANTRGFAFQASLLCLLIQAGFSYKQIGCVANENRDKGGHALTWRNLLSVAHVLCSIFLRRVSAMSK